MKIILLGNSLSTMINFRKQLIDYLAEKNHQVFLIVPIDMILPNNLFRRNVYIKNINFSRSIKIHKECKSIFQAIKYLKEIKPDIVFSYSLKICIFSMLVVWKAALYNVITGRGSAFKIKKYRCLTISILYIINFIRKFSKKTIFIFLNKNDLSFFLEKKLFDKDSCFELPGEGIDLEKFRFSPIIKVNIFTFLFIGRFIKDKGVLELIEACRKMKKRQVNFQVIFIAPLDKENPTSLHHDISLKDLDKLGIEYVPYVSDVRAYIRKSHCVVLPSYGEGMPLSLLEGMAIGRPIITTNAPGCKDLVDNNGLLVSVKSTESLYEAMLAMTRKDLVSLQNMGLNGRKFVEGKYSIFYVLNKYQELIDNIKDKRKE